VALDSQVSETVLDFTERTVRADEADGFVVSGTAEALSQVTVKLSADGKDPVEYTTTADAGGRFHVQVAAGSFGLGTVSVVAWSVDRAGNRSGDEDSAPSTFTVTEAAPAATLVEGSVEDEQFVSTDAASTFVPGFGWGEDHYIGSASGFHTVQIDGSGALYAISVVKGDALETQKDLLQDLLGITLDEGVPLYLIENCTNLDDRLWVQADRVVFNDATVRLTDDGVVVGATLSGQTQTIHGYTGDDHIVGGAGEDTLFGYDGTDVLVGGDGDDTLVSNSGTDELIGGEGNDMLVVFGDAASGAGTAVELHGGAGEDVFVVAPQAGFDRNVTIEDFVIGEDKIDLSWLRVNDGGTYRAITADDLDLESLSSDLQKDGQIEIDLSTFVTRDNESISGGTLQVHLGGGVSTLTEDSFILSESGDTLDVLLMQAQLPILL